MSSPPASSGTAESKDSQKDEVVPKKPGIFKRLWSKSGLNPVILILMFKGALAPTIALAAYQGDAFANQYTTLGYLVAIMAMLSMPIQPRAKFIQGMLTSIFFVCLGAAISLLQIQCVVAARQSTTPPAPQVVGQSGSGESTAYSAAASTTSGVWLFITIWLANVVRAYRPQLMLPSIQYAIFTVVASVYSPLFPNMAQGESFARRLLITFLTGFAIATGVCLFIFPITSRQMTKAQMGGLAGLIKGILGMHGRYLQSVVDSHSKGTDAKDQGAEEAKKLQKMTTDAGILYGKIRLELGFARKEIAFGKWRPSDFSDVFKQLRDILLPAISLSTFLQIMQTARTKSEDQTLNPENVNTLEIVKRLEQEEWDELLAMSQEPYKKLQKSLSGGLDHICSVLEITKKPKSKKTDEEQLSANQPGSAGFTATLEADMKAFYEYRETVIKRWCDNKGIKMPSSFWEDRDATVSLERVATLAMQKKQNQQQLYLILYVEFLVHSIGKAIVNMAKYADRKASDGSISKRKFINPGWRRLKKLVWSAFHATETDNFFSHEEGNGPSISVGDSLKQRKDPEHMAPVTAYQRTTEHFRTVVRILASPEAAFAFRAAIATMSLGVIAFLRQEYLFFLRERGLWALIMVAISMSPHSGQGVFGFAARIFGTCVAMVASIVIWYIGYKQPAAIIPIFFIYLTGGILFLIKNPTYAIVGMISMVTAILIIGYELQAQKIGIALATSNGQPFYDIYLLAPYRLAAVCIGLGAAFVFTYFPYPVSTHATLRKDLGRTLYLLAHYYSSAHASVDAKLRLGASASEKNSPMAKLEKERLKVLQKCVLMIARLREQSQFVKFDISFGGKFPKQQYDHLIDSISNIFQYLNLVAYSSDTFSRQSEDSVWLRDFRQFTADINLTSHELTSTLCLLAASISNGQPLPPYLKISKPYNVAQRLEAVDPEILSIQHVTEPCYAAFAVLEVASSLLAEEVASIANNVRELVGEVDFSFHVTSARSENSSVKDEEKGKQA